MFKPIGTYGLRSESSKYLGSRGLTQTKAGAGFEIWEDAPLASAERRFSMEPARITVPAIPTGLRKLMPGSMGKRHGWSKPESEQGTQEINRACR